MMNQFSSLELSKRALDYFRRGMETSGHNIANADVEGYSRQRVEASTTIPFTDPGLSRPWSYGQIGTGVKVDAIVRLRDAFLDAQYNEETTVQGYWDQIQDALKNIELYVNEPNGKGFKVAMDEYWAALQEASKRPDDSAIRSNLVEKTRSVTVMMDQLIRNYDEYRANLNEEVALRVQEANTLIDEIAELNVTITEIEGVGWNPNDLYDKRDLKLSQLSELINCKPATMCDIEDGHYKIYLDGKLIVQGPEVRHLELVKVPGNGGFFDVQVEDNEFDIVSNPEVAGVKVTRQAPEAVHQLFIKRLAKEEAWAIGGAKSVTEGGARLAVKNKKDALNLCGFFDLQVSTQGVQVQSEALTTPPAAHPGDLLGHPGAGDLTEYSFKAGAGNSELTIKAAWDGTNWELSNNSDNYASPEDAATPGILNITDIEDYFNNHISTPNDFLFASVNTAGTVLTLESVHKHHISIADVHGNLMTKAGLADKASAVTIKVEEDDTLQDIANKINGAYKLTPPADSEVTFPGGKAPDSPEEWVHASVEEDGNKEFYLKVTSNTMGEQYRINIRGDAAGNLTVIKRLGLLGQNGGTAFLSMAQDALFTFDNRHYLSAENHFFEARRITSTDGYSADTLEVVSPGIEGQPPNHVEHPLKISPGVPGIHFGFNDTGKTEITVKHHVKGGKIFALLESRDDILLDKISTFDEIVFGMVAETNALHYAGHGTGGYSNLTGQDFFVPVGVRNGASRRFSINEVLAHNTALLGFAADNGKGETAGLGDGTNVLHMAQLKQADILVAHSYSINEFYEGFIAKLGAEGQRAKSMLTNQEHLVTQIDNQRQAVMGVNIDEEMITIIKFQHAFNAMSRMVTTTDECLDKIINGMGIVGR